jgi:hypothetical protein
MALRPSQPKTTPSRLSVGGDWAARNPGRVKSSFRLAERPIYSRSRAKRRIYPQSGMAGVSAPHTLMIRTHPSAFEFFVALRNSSFSDPDFFGVANFCGNKK